MRELAFEVDWLLTRLLDEVPGLDHVFVFSADGRPIALSRPVSNRQIHQAARVVASWGTVMHNLVPQLGCGPARQILVELQQGALHVTSISDGSFLAALASTECVPALLAYEMTRLADALGQMLTPAVHRELRTLCSCGGCGGTGRVWPVLNSGAVVGLNHVGGDIV
ncbi:roadblock/LC7 domain-containing protein [Nonomuraea sp. KM90]|uniref:roadblock/LC7 domain-containing protein n=1 Tax=Nonomuraea sp. KM90 TaxID=3457428 RepID=UPI003FCD9591